MTVVTVPVIRRPLDGGMFVDITDAKLTRLDASGAVFADNLTSLQIAKVRIRLMTADDDDEQTVLKAWTALQANQDFLGVASPTNVQAIAQVQALTRQMDAVIKFVLQLQ